MDMVDILFDDAELFEQIDNTPSTESPVWKFVKLFQRRRCLKITIFFTVI